MKKVVVVQFRTDPSEAHEQKCIRENLEGFPVELQFVSGVKGELPVSLLDEVSAVILGGSGEFHLTDGDGKDTWMPRVTAFIEQVFARDIPMLGLCFGMQILAVDAGADIVADPAMAEVGGYEVTLNEQAKADPLFSHIKSPFVANFAHKDTNINLPEHIEVLGGSERVPCEIFRIKNRQVWGVMFHAEMTQLHMMERLYLYLENGRGEYADDDGAEETAARFAKTSEANEVLVKFVELAFGENGRAAAGQPAAAGQLTTS